MSVRPNFAWLFAVMAVVGMYNLSLAQDGIAPSATTQTTNGQPPVGDLPSNRYPPNSRGQEVGTSAYSMLGNRSPASVVPLIRQAAEAVRDAEGVEAKAEAQERLMEYLVQYFDKDMTRREQELSEIEQRVVKLRELLDRRQTRKQEIIDLQAKVALNDAEGLGFDTDGSENVPGGPPTTAERR